MSILLLAPGLAHAAGTTAWELNSFADFIKGRFNGVSLSRDGRLTLGPKLDPVFSADQPVIWSLTSAPDGTLYAATGNRGRVYKIDRNGAASLYWSATEPEVFAVAVDGSGALYAGTSPDGRIYRIENGQAQEFFNPKTRYIWSLAVGPDGALYAGTGDKGEIYRITATGKGEVYYSTGQSHVTALALDRQGRLLAGTDPNGILYRISAKDQAFVLYDAALPEIRSIAPMPDGTVYAVALGGAVAKQTAAASQTQNNPNTQVVQGPSYSVTVTADNGNVSEIKPQDAKPAQPLPAAAATSQSTSTFASTPDTTNVDKSSIFRINPDNTVENLWTSKDENAYALVALEKQLLFSTDQSGRIYGLFPDRRLTLLAQTNEGETLQLVPADHSILAATGNMGRVLRMGEGPGAAGSFESPVHDTGAASRWGSLSWRAEMPTGAAILFRTRSGNSARPDRTWSAWSDPLTDPSASRISSPNARYIQWKLELAGGPSALPVVNSVSLSYLPRNLPPVIHAVNVVMTASAAQQNAHPSASTGSSGAAFSVTVSDSDASASTAAGAVQTLPRSFTQQITVAWAADDPDNDRLVYALYFRGDDEAQWKLLKGGLHETSFTFDADVLADGKYSFRLTASDKESNPPSTARDTLMDSAPVIVDSTPPVVTVTSHAFNNGSAHIEWEAADKMSPLRRAEYSVDAGDWIQAEAADGVIDSLREKFTLDLQNLKPGEHLVVVRAADSANNTGVAKVVLK